MVANFIRLFLIQSKRKKKKINVIIIVVLINVCFFFFLTDWQKTLSIRCCIKFQFRYSKEWTSRSSSHQGVLHLQIEIKIISTTFPSQKKKTIFFLKGLFSIEIEKHLRGWFSICVRVCVCVCETHTHSPLTSYLTRYCLSSSSLIQRDSEKSFLN
jgi:hypothetical protein